MKVIRDYEKYIDVNANDFGKKRSKKHLRKMKKEEKKDFLLKKTPSKRRNPGKDEIEY